MSNIKKRALSTLLTLAMLCTLLPSIAPRAAAATIPWTNQTFEGTQSFSGATDITLEGDNVINVTSGIGIDVTGSNSRVAFTGSGSLTINLKGNNTTGVQATSTVWVTGSANVSIVVDSPDRSGVTGIKINSAFFANAADLQTQGSGTLYIDAGSGFGSIGATMANRYLFATGTSSYITGYYAMKSYGMDGVSNVFGSTIYADNPSTAIKGQWYDPAGYILTNSGSIAKTIRFGAVPNYTATVTLTANGTPVATPAVTLSTSATALAGEKTTTSTSSPYSFGGLSNSTTYYVFVNGFPTGKSVSSSSKDATVTGYAVNWAADPATTAHGAVSGVKYDSKAIVTSTLVPGGKTLVYTVAPAATRTSYLKAINDAAPTTGYDAVAKTYTVTNLAAAQNLTFTFGNWEQELATVYNGKSATEKADALKTVFGSGAITATAAEKADRARLQSAFPNLPAAFLAGYDDILDKDMFWSQYQEKMPTAEKVVSDLIGITAANIDSSTLGKFYNVQKALEANPTMPTVTVTADGKMTVTPPTAATTPVVIVVKDSAGTAIPAADGKYDLTDAVFAAPNNFVTVETTDANGYVTTVKVTVNKTDYAVKQTHEVLTPEVGGTVVITAATPGPNAGATATLDDEHRTTTFYTATGIQWQQLEGGYHAGKFAGTTTTTLVAEPVDGAYFVGFELDGTTYLPAELSALKLALGDSAATYVENQKGSTDLADWVYTLTYTPNGAQTITAKYRNLLGEINTATTNDQIASVIADDHYKAVIHSGSTFNALKPGVVDGTTESIAVTGTLAKDAFDDLGKFPATTRAAAQGAVLAKLKDAVGEKADYTIVEFNDALYWLSQLQNRMDNGKSKVEEAHTPGSWAELQRVLGEVSAEFDAADGDPTITTNRVKILADTMQRALNQLLLKTLAIEFITNAVDGTGNTVSFTATNPAQATTAAKNGQNGYAYPVYGSNVPLTVTTSPNYRVAYELDGTSSNKGAVTRALTEVRVHHTVKITFNRIVENVHLTDGVTLTSRDVSDTEGKQANRGDTIYFKAVPPVGYAFVPGAKVYYTVNGIDDGLFVTVAADGSFSIPTIPGEIAISDTTELFKPLNKASLNTALEAIQTAYDSSKNAIYDTTDLTYTPDTWKALFGAGAGTYGGAYAAAKVVLTDYQATPAMMQEAYNNLLAAVNGLRKQHTVTLASGFTIAEGQTDVAKINGTYYVAEGASVALTVNPGTGKVLNKISYETGGQTLYAWEVGNSVTIYGVSAPVTSLAMSTSDIGFAVVVGSAGLGEADGLASAGTTYTITPKVGQDMTAVTVDGVAYADLTDIDTTGKDYAIAVDGDGVVTITWNATNSGGHSVSATTAPKVYDVTIADDGAEPPVPVGGITADKETVAHGSNLVLTIPATEGKEVSFDTTLTGDPFGTNVKLSALDEEHFTVTRLENGSVTVEVKAATGEVNVTAADVVFTEGGLTAKKADFLARLATLDEALVEANRVAENDGAIYDETTPKWEILTKMTEGEIDVKEILSDALNFIDLDSIDTEADFIAALQEAMTAIETDSEKLLTLIDKATEELTKATEEAKLYAEKTIDLPGKATVVQPGLDAENEVTVTTGPVVEDGKFNPDSTYDLMVAPIHTKAGYLPIVTFTVDGRDVALKVVPDGEGGWKAVTGDPAEDVTGVTIGGNGIDATDLTGDFTLTIGNADLLAVLGKDGVLGDITAVVVSAYRLGREMTDAQALYDSALVGSSKGLAQVDIDVEDGTGADFIAGTNANNAGITPVVGTDDTATIKLTYTDDFYKFGGNTWYKALFGITIGDEYYAVDELPEGITYTPGEVNEEGRIQDGAIAIDTAVYTGELLGITLDIRPTNSQYTTWLDEYQQVVDHYELAEGQGLSSISAQELTEMLKQANRLVEQATKEYDAATVPARYFLTQENKDYLADQIAQLKEIQVKVDALSKAKGIYDEIEALYAKAKEMGLNLPAGPYTSDEQKAIAARLASEVENLESKWNGLNALQQSLVDSPAPGHLQALVDAMAAAREDGMTGDSVFNARVDVIDGLIGDPTPYTIADPDKVATLIDAANAQYDDMTDAEKAAAAVKKELLDELAEKLADHLADRALKFAKEWLTTDYNGNSDAAGTAGYDNDTNRLNSEADKEGYGHRVALAKEKYDALPKTVQAAVDGVFASPTVPELYLATFPDVEDIVTVTDEVKANNFIRDYLTRDKKVVTKADYNNYSQILSGESPWDKLSDVVKDMINTKLVDVYKGVDYPTLLAQAKALKETGDAAKAFIDANLKYGGKVITAKNDDNKDTILAAKTPWDALGSTVQQAVNDLLTGTHKGKTYPVLYKDASGTGGGDTPSGGGGGGGKPVVTAPVIVDGKSVNIGTVDILGDTTTVTVDQKQLEKQMESAKNGSAVEVPLSGTTNAAAVTFVVKNVEEMAGKEMVLEVRFDGVTYLIRTAAIDTAALAEAVGESDTSKIPFTVTISKSGSKTQAAVAAAAQKEGFAVTVAPVDFSIVATHGGKSVDVKEFNRFVKRTIEITAEQAAKITTAIVYEADGSVRHVPTYVYEKGGKWFADINSRTNSTYVLIYNEVTFRDVDNTWYSAAANEMGSRKVVEGIGKNTFDGTRAITRAEFAVMLVRALGLSESGTAGFSDVPAKAWYAGAVAVAARHGLVQGYKGNFMPDARITRQEAMVMLARAAALTDLVDKGTVETTFSDADQVAKWAAEGVDFNISNGLIIGVKGKLLPTDEITRAETATVLLRLLQNAELVDVRSEV